MIVQEPPTLVEASKPKVDPDFTQKQFLGTAKGKQLRLGTMTGTAIVGELVAFSDYSLLLRLKGGEELLLYKHAIAYIRHERAEKAGQRETTP